MAKPDKKEVKKFEFSKVGTILDNIAKNVPIHIDKEVMGGEPVFTGTRVPIQSLFDNLEDGMSLAEFMDNFPSVTNEMIVAVLELAAKRLRVA